jgi:hypothetical protein
MMGIEAAPNVPRKSVLDVVSKKTYDAPRRNEKRKSDKTDGDSPRRTFRREAALS